MNRLFKGCVPISHETHHKFSTALISNDLKSQSYRQQYIIHESPIDTPFPGIICKLSATFRNFGDCLLVVCSLQSAKLVVTY